MGSSVLNTKRDTRLKKPVCSLKNRASLCFLYGFDFQVANFLGRDRNLIKNRVGSPAWFFMTCTAIEQSISESRLSFRHLLLMRYGMEILPCSLQNCNRSQKKERKQNTLYNSALSQNLIELSKERIKMPYVQTFG